MSRMVIGVAAAVVWLAVSLPAKAQPVPGNDRGYTTHSCGAPPYSVGIAVAGGQVLAHVGEDAIKALPELSLRAGGEVARSAYAGMRNQAVGEVLQWYRCRLEHNLRTDGGEDTEKKVSALYDTFGDIETQIILAEAASGSGFDSFQQYINSLADVERSRSGLTLAPATFDRYFADVDPERTWIKTTTVRGWIEGGASGVTISACGGIVRAAISDGSSSLQASLARLKSGLRNYLDPGRQPRIGLLGMLAGFAGNPVNLTPAQAQTFQGCATAVDESQNET